MTITSSADTKLCSLCGLTKPFDDFHKSPLGRDGRQSRCKVCAIAKAREAYLADPEKKKAQVAAWVAANPERTELTQRRSRMKKYGITLADYEDRLGSQGGACAICRVAEPGRGRKHFCVDHDHKTGAVRGLLCMNCNDGLGRFKDRPEVLLAAVEYLGANY